MTDFLLAAIHLDPVAMLSAGGYLGLALAVFAETGLLIGIFLPGDSLLFAAGLLSSGGFLAIQPLVLIVVVAAILGDSVGYWLGMKAGDSLAMRPDSRFFKREYLTRTEQFFATYGGRAVVLARFVPIVRTIAPLFAGAGSMRYRTFLAYNVIGGILWGAGMLLLGYSLGSIVPESEKYLLPISLAIIAISFFPILINLARGKRVV